LKDYLMACSPLAPQQIKGIAVQGSFGTAAGYPASSVAETALERKAATQIAGS
jgi:hypothetical protein